MCFLNRKANDDRVAIRRIAWPARAIGTTHLGFHIGCWSPCAYQFFTPIHATVVCQSVGGIICFMPVLTHVLQPGDYSPSLSCLPVVASILSAGVRRLVLAHDVHGSKLIGVVVLSR